MQVSPISRRLWLEKRPLDQLEDEIVSLSHRINASEYKPRHIRRVFCDGALVRDLIPRDRVATGIGHKGVVGGRDVAVRRIRPERLPRFTNHVHDAVVS